VDHFAETVPTGHSAQLNFAIQPPRSGASPLKVVPGLLSPNDDVPQHGPLRKRWKPPLIQHPNAAIRILFHLAELVNWGHSRCTGAFSVCDTWPLRRVAYLTCHAFAHRYVIRMSSGFDRSDIEKIVVLCTLVSLFVLPLVIPA